MVSGSPRLRPSATLMGSMSPTRSATLVSGVASFSVYRSLRWRHATGRPSPEVAARRIDSGVIGEYGCSFSSDPSITGVHSSSRPVNARSSRVLPCPRSPSRTMSWPAMRARSSCGRTVSSKPRMPGHTASPCAPAASRARRLSRISALTPRSRCPEARSSPTVRGRSFGAVTSPRYDCSPTEALAALVNGRRAPGPRPAPPVAQCAKCRAPVR